MDHIVFVFMCDVEWRNENTRMTIKKFAPNTIRYVRYKNLKKTINKFAVTSMQPTTLALTYVIKRKHTEYKKRWKRMILILTYVKNIWVMLKKFRPLLIVC